jgi:hypothetical protein
MSSVPLRIASSWVWPLVPVVVVLVVLVGEDRMGSRQPLVIAVEAAEHS